MNPRFEPILGSATAIAAVACAAVLSAGRVYAETPTIDKTPFVSQRSAAEVRAEVMAYRRQLSSAGVEWTLNRNDPQPIASTTTPAEARAAYLAAREETSALTSEDSGSSSLARRAVAMTPRPVMVSAGAAR
jgi:hypothetical protein